MNFTLTGSIFPQIKWLYETNVCVACWILISNHKKYPKHLIESKYNTMKVIHTNTT